MSLFDIIFDYRIISHMRSAMKYRREHHSFADTAEVSQAHFKDLNMQCRRLIGRIYLTITNTSSKGALWTLYKIVLLLILTLYPCSASHTWEQPGCHRVGHTRLVNIPDCVVFNVTLNACRGFCESYAIPSPSRTLSVNMKHLITSRAECCSVKETHDVKVLVKCVDGLREVIFKSAKECSCSICRK